MEYDLRIIIIFNSLQKIIHLMSQTQLISKKPWVLVSSLKDNPQEQDLQKITFEINNLIDEWYSQGKIMWSGAFDDNKTSMTIFEATENEARNLFSKYDKICVILLNCYLYQ